MKRGETKQWLTLAIRLGKSLQETQSIVSSTEFVLWKAYLDDEPNDFNPLFYYLANIAKEVERTHAKRPGKITTEKKLLHFERKKQPAPAESLTDEQRKSRLANSKRFWLTGVGLKNKLREN